MLTGLLSLASYCKYRASGSVLHQSRLLLQGWRGSTPCCLLKGRRCASVEWTALQGWHCTISLLRRRCCRDGVVPFLTHAAGTAHFLARAECTALHGWRYRDGAAWDGAAGAVLQGRRCIDGAAPSPWDAGCRSHYGISARTTALMSRDRSGQGRFAVDREWGDQFHVGIQGCQ